MNPRYSIGLRTYGFTGGNILRSTATVCEFIHEGGLFLVQSPTEYLDFGEYKGRNDWKKSAYYLVDRKEFNLDKDIVSHFTGFATKFFHGV